MNLMESEWFFRMVDQQNSTPAGRMIAVFSVAEQWISAPGIREQIKSLPSSTEHLQAYLTRTAISAKAENPSVLSTQLLILFQGAIAEQLRNPESRALQHAAIAAQAVVSKACRSNKKIRMVRWSATASILVVVMATLLWQIHTPETKMLATNQLDDTFMRTVMPIPGGVNSSMMTATLTLQRKIDSGICPAPHLLVIPSGQTIAYMNVISFRAPDNPAVDRANLDAFLTWYEQILARECYYPPIPRATVTLR